jgi:hypothetical protein
MVRERDHGRMLCRKCGKDFKVIEEKTNSAKAT